MGSEIVPETACLQVVGAPSGVTAYFLHNGPASYSCAARLSDERSRSESESEQGVQSRGVDPKPSELSMGRLKRG
jgi:hypothetical protein